MMVTKIFLSILLLYNLAVLPTQTAQHQYEAVDYIYPDGKTLKKEGDFWTQKKRDSLVWTVLVAISQKINRS